LNEEGTESGKGENKIFLCLYFGIDRIKKSATQPWCIADINVKYTNKVDYNLDVIEYNQDHNHLGFYLYCMLELCNRHNERDSRMNHKDLEIKHDFSMF